MTLRDIYIEKKLTESSYSINYISHKTWSLVNKFLVCKYIVIHRLQRSHLKLNHPRVRIYNLCSIGISYETLIMWKKLIVYRYILIDMCSINCKSQRFPGHYYIYHCTGWSLLYYISVLVTTILYHCTGHYYLSLYWSLLSIIVLDTTIYHCTGHYYISLYWSLL